MNKPVYDLQLLEGPQMRAKNQLIQEEMNLMSSAGGSLLGSIKPERPNP